VPPAAAAAGAAPITNFFQAGAGDGTVSVAAPSEVTAQPPVEPPAPTAEAVAAVAQAAAPAASAAPAAPEAPAPPTAEAMEEIS
jgi:hypothetical protein